MRHLNSTSETTMITQEKITVTASVRDGLVEDFSMNIPSSEDCYDEHGCGFSGKIPEIETYDAYDCLYEYKGSELVLGDKPQTLKISVELDLVEVQSSNDEISEEQLQKIALDLVRQPFIFEGYTDYSEDFEGYAVLIQDICYELENRQVSEGVVITTCCWAWSSLKVLEAK